MMLSPLKNKILTWMYLYRSWGLAFSNFGTTEKQVVQRLELSYKGSDGMSDFVYPYSVHWISEDLYGGCTSNHQNRK